jgi:hypothetical protein
LLHHITTDLLEQSYYALKRNSAPGIDGVTWQAYGENLEEKLTELHARIHRGGYRARPARRTHIPKPDGSQRPLSILCLEDKIVQQAVVFVLEAIYEADFIGFSYGFRPGRGQHDALDALHAGIYRRRVNWVLDADIQGFFDAMSHDWMMRFYHGWAPRRAQPCGYAPGSGDLTDPGEHLPALCVRPMDPSLATEEGNRRHDRHPLRGRHRARL